MSKWIKDNQASIIAIAGAAGAIAHDSGWSGHDDTIGVVVLAVGLVSAVVNAFASADKDS